MAFPSVECFLNRDKPVKTEWTGENWARGCKKQSDARATGDAVMLQVQHDKPPLKQWGHTLHACCSSHFFSTLRSTYFQIDLLLLLIVTLIAPFSLKSNFCCCYSSRSFDYHFPSEVFPLCTRADRIQLCHSLAQSVFIRQITILSAERVNSGATLVEVITAKHHSRRSLITSDPSIPGKHYCIQIELN